jgi:hypothetical protein
LYEHNMNTLFSLPTFLIYNGLTLRFWNRLHQQVEEYTGPSVVIHVDEETQFVPQFRWLPELQAALTSEPPVARIYLVSQHASRSGLLGLINCLKNESRDTVRCALFTN